MAKYLTTMAPRAREKQQPIPINITISGSGGCGKSSITLRLVRSQWVNSYDPTIEDSYSVTRIVDGQPYILHLTDTAGQEEYRSMWAASNLRSDAFLLVYDITSIDSLEELEFFNDLVDMEGEQRGEKNAAFDEMRRKTEERGYPFKLKTGSEKKQPKMLARPIKILAGNKCDLSADRQVPATVGLDWARKRNCGFMETSARNVVNIEETFALIVRRVMEARKVAEMATSMGLEAVRVVGEEVIEGYDRGGYDRFGRKLLTPMQGIDDGGSGSGNGDRNGIRNGRTTSSMTRIVSSSTTQFQIARPASPLPPDSEEMEKSSVDGYVRGRGKGRWWHIRGWGLKCW